MPPRRCPCGTGLPLAECCGRLHEGSARAATAEQLMRSRYSAFALGDEAYLLRTWHPTTRPTTPELDREGTVEFRASHVAAGRAGAQLENSRFVREGGSWCYLDGVSLG